MATNDWSRVACIASGPSLKKTDCEKVMASGMKVVAVNTSWRIVPDCDVLFAADDRWWRHNKPETRAEKWTASENAAKSLDINFRKNPFGNGYCSGLLAAEFACWKGAKKVVLLGYDCTVENGLHWHGRHQDTANPSEALCRQWALHFPKLSNLYPETSIINASRNSVLTCFNKMELELALA